MSSKDDDVDRKLGPKMRDDRNKDPAPSVPFGADEFTAENLQTTGHVDQAIPLRETLQKEVDGKKPVFGADEAPVEVPSSSMNATAASAHTSYSTMQCATTTRPALASTRPYPLGGTMERERLVVPSAPSPRRARDEEVNHSLPGAERVSGYGTGYSGISRVDDDTIMVGGDDDVDEARVSRMSARLMANAQLVDDPIVAAEIDADTTGELKLQLTQSENKKRRLVGIGVGVALFLGGAFIAVLSVLLRKGSPLQLKEAWIRLIQTAMSSRAFEDTASPQWQALDWMIQDSYTKTLIGDDDRILQRFALAVFYYSSNVPSNNSNMERWLDPESECSWENVGCTDEVVDGLALEDGGLSGHIPSEVRLLSGLTSLSLSGNTVEGSIPTEIGFLTSLMYLDLGVNALEGSIPSEMGFLTSLAHLDIGNINFLEGRLPSDDLAFATSMTPFDLVTNSLEGSIPSEIGFLTSLTYLDLYGTYVGGTIPSEIGLLTGLTSLFLSENSLEGSIPSEIGFLTSLTYLDLVNNMLGGKIPSEIGLMTGLEWLSLHSYSDYMYGSIPTEVSIPKEDASLPSEVGFLTSLTYLDLVVGGLKGNIPSEVGLLTGLISLSFRSYSDHAEGNIPSEVGFLTSLAYLDLQIGNWQGNIPSEVGLLTGLVSLSLSLYGDNFDGDNFEGTIPSEVGFLTSLASLYLDIDSLKGNIPSEIGSLTGLTSFSLRNNIFESSIPSEIGLLSALTSLSLTYNNLVGSIPSETGLLTGLMSLSLYDNKVEGSIPSEAGLLTSLTYLDLEINKLEGSIPSEIGLLTALTDLWLSNNHNLTDSVPTELGNLAHLESLYFHNTNLSGSIPSTLCDTLLNAQIDCDKIECDCCTSADFMSPC